MAGMVHPNKKGAVALRKPQLIKEVMMLGNVDEATAFKMVDTTLIALKALMTRESFRLDTDIYFPVTAFGKFEISISEPYKKESFLTGKVHTIPRRRHLKFFPCREWKEELRKE